MVNEAPRRPAACPNCGADRAPQAAECGGCGLIFAKHAAIQERARRAALEAAAEMERLAALPRPEAPTRAADYRGVAVGVVVGWLVAFAFWCALSPRTRLGGVRVIDATRQNSALLQDPDTGRTVRVDVTRARERAAPEPPPAPEPEAPVEPSDEFESEAEAEQLDSR